MISNELLLKAAGELADAGTRLAATPAVIGFDGFVDTILRVVDQRRSPAEFTPVREIAEFGARIAAAAGLSANIELVTELVKPGGNGPNTANGLLQAGCPVTYIGSLGSPSLHPVFASFAAAATVHSICEPGFTDAVEFEDGKLMFGKHGNLRGVNWETLTRHLPPDQLAAIFAPARLLALMNWTMLPLLEGILENLLGQVLPGLPASRRTAFFDLCDPAKRTAEDLVRALRTIARYQQFCEVVLGLNFSESVRVGEVLGMAAPETSPAAVTAHARAIREKLGIAVVLIHPTAFAAAASADGAWWVPGPYLEKPRITTGAGDNFNAGYLVGALLGCAVETCLQLGVGTSGYYVRHAASPTPAELAAFLRQLAGAKYTRRHK